MANIDEPIIDTLTARVVLSRREVANTDALKRMAMAMLVSQMEKDLEQYLEIYVQNDGQKDSNVFSVTAKLQVVRRT